MSNTQKRIVVVDDPENCPEEPWMEFRLTYEGPLRSTQGEPWGDQRDPRAEHKHEIRRVFHKQLRRLWEITPFLREGKSTGPEPITLYINSLPLIERPISTVRDAHSLALQYAQFGFKFVPLVTTELNLVCGLDILFLRPDKPGNLWRGDIDNRVKTLLDALSVPEANDRYCDRTPAEDEKPFYCLLEDDALITKLSVETDQLLETDGSPDPVRLVVTVRLRPYELHLGNIQFGRPR